MIKKFKVIPVPTKDNTGIILITRGVCAGSLVKKEYYGMLNEDMGDTYVHLIGIGDDVVKKGYTIFNLNTREIYNCKEEYGIDCEKVILFSTDSSLTYTSKFEYKIPTIHHSTYTDLIQQHNHSDGMWLEVIMEKPESPERTDDVHFDAIMFNQWLDIKDKWFIKIFNGIVVVNENELETIHPNELALNYLKESNIKGANARVVAGAFKAGMYYAAVHTDIYSNAAKNFLKNTTYNIKEEQVKMVIKAFEAGADYVVKDDGWKVNSVIKPPTGGEYNVVWKLDDGQYPVTSSMDWDAIKKVWTDPRCDNCERYDEVLYWKELPSPPKFIDEKFWKL